MLANSSSCDRFAIVASHLTSEQLAAEGTPQPDHQVVVGRLDTFIAASAGHHQASLALGWIGEPAFAHLVEPLLAPVTGSFSETAAHGIAVGVSFGLITALHIVVGELAPKGLALQRPEATTLVVARPLQLFEIVFRLPIRLLNDLGNGVLRLFGLEPASGHSMAQSVDELRVLVSGMQRAGIVDEVEARIAGRAFRFGEVTVGELQTPRTDVAGIPLEATIESAVDAAVSSGHSRLVVFDGSMDNIVGVVHLRDQLRAQRTGSVAIRAVLRSCWSRLRPADALLAEMRLASPTAVVLTSTAVRRHRHPENLFEALVGRRHPTKPLSSRAARPGNRRLAGNGRAHPPGRTGGAG